MTKILAPTLARVVILSTALLLLVAPASAVVMGGHGHGPKEVRNFDARTGANEGVEHAPTERQLHAVERMKREIPGLLVRFDRTTGATRALTNPVGLLTASAQGSDPRGAAANFIYDNLDLLGLEPEDVEGFEVADEVPSPVSGATHLYLTQSHDGIPVYNAQLGVHVASDGRIISVSNGFAPGLARAVGPTRGLRGAEHAVAAAAEHLGVELAGLPAVLSRGDDVRQTTVVEPAGLSLEPIEAELAWLPVNRGTARLVWNFQIQTLDSQHWFDMTVDARSGKVWTSFDWVSDASYRVYPLPVESPQHTSPLPPSDARVLVTDPEDATASPLGWHDTGADQFTIMQGNNVHAFEDSSPNNRPPRNEPSCGSNLSCDFPIDLTQEPDSYVDAAVANLFYWNNIIHDVQYQYGFDEAGGNFQENNFSRGGVGGDPVEANAQDGSGNCNANFATPTDGGQPRMQMFLCDNVSPTRDGDFDDGVIVHEYGHGISIRQVGGPSTSSCLNNTQQPGEGWSDWFALAYTADSGDTGAEPRGVGSYLFGLAPDGTIRPQQYSTDPTVNTYTYESIEGVSVPHGVGSVWAQVLWEAYWALVNQHGFDPDLYNAMGPAGNQRAMLYVNEGLKQTACSPSLLDTRDGVIAAATNLHGGEDVCTLWQVFANFGLGTDAATSGSGTQEATNGFQLPAECRPSCDTPPAAPTNLTATAVSSSQIDLSWDAVTEAVSYDVLRSTTSGGPYEFVANVTTTSFSDTGLSSGTTYFYVVRSVNADGCVSADSNEASATTSGPTCTTTTLYTNNFDSGSGLDDWTLGAFVNGGKATEDWRGIQACTAASGSNIFRFGGESCTADYGNRDFTFAQPQGATGISVPSTAQDVRLDFNHRYDFEGGFDGGTLTVSLDGSNYFVVPGSAILSGESYNGTVAPNCPPSGAAGVPIFTGSQPGFASSEVDLDAACDVASGGTGGCAGQTIFIGFTGITDCGVTADGWFLDDVTVTACIP